MYHGVSPAATSGGTNGNMVSLCFPSFISSSSLVFFPCSKCRRPVAPPTPKLPIRQRANRSRHIPTFTSYLISLSQSRVLSQESSPLVPNRQFPPTHVGACPVYLGLIGRPGPKVFFLCSVILIDDDNIYRPFSLIDSLIASPITHC